jgi:phage terminase small subunit
MIDPPIWLTAGARRVFDVTCRRIESDHRPPERFAMMIAMYAQAVEEWEKASMAVSTEGVIIARGERRVANPQLVIRDQAHSKMERLSDELGLSPSSAIAKDEPWDPDAYCDTLEDVEAEMAAEQALQDVPTDTPN